MSGSITVVVPIFLLLCCSFKDLPPSCLSSLSLSSVIETVNRAQCVFVEYPPRNDTLERVISVTENSPILFESAVSSSGRMSCLVCVYVCMCVCVCLCVCIHMCVHACMFMCVCVCAKISALNDSPSCIHDISTHPMILASLLIYLITLME